MSSLIEDLPNELLFDVFQYLDTRDLYESFWGLNHRFNNILRSLKDLSLTMEKNNPSLLTIFASRIARLEVNTWHEIDLIQFINLKSLILHRTTRNQITQIRPNVIPKLVSLSISLAFDFWSSAQLAQDVFSNGFPSLRNADLGRVDVPYTRSWSLSPYLYPVCVCSADPIIVPLILASCPRLRNLQVQIFGDNHRIDLPSLHLHHPLRRFTFVDSHGILSLHDINLLLIYMPNIECIHLTLFEMSFHLLARTLIHRLHRLHQFDCYINESPDSSENMDRIRAVHPCFHHLQYFEKNHGIRHFTNRQK
ncbi:unnamed protein product [Adineta steineri]|uniref:F-box domain-containing protein n=1 Tax=Adineta steineri TaxID=433720 RepID=A0A814KQH6_9BILA|nr:unnamed protein product [Adineta steineri]